jgi:hypothetical protein
MKVKADYTLAEEPYNNPGCSIGARYLNTKLKREPFVAYKDPVEHEMRPVRVRKPGSMRY